MTQPARIGSIPEWTLGWRLQRSLAESGLTAQQMADRLGVVRGTVSRWMNDHGKAPKTAFINQWALATGTPVAWLITGEQSNPKGPDDSDEGGTTDGEVLLPKPANVTPLRRLTATLPDTAAA